MVRDCNTPMLMTMALPQNIFHCAMSLDQLYCCPVPPSTRLPAAPSGAWDQEVGPILVSEPRSHYSGWVRAGQTL